LGNDKVSAPRGSLLAFAQDDVVLRLNPYPTHYRSAFAFSTILYPQLYRPSSRLAFRQFPWWKATGLPRSVSITRSV